MITSIVNISLNLIFVLGFQAAIAGSARATVLSQMLSAFLLLLATRKMLRDFLFQPSRAAIDLLIFPGRPKAQPAACSAFFSFLRRQPAAAECPQRIGL
ncbi:MAG: hypothetical protein LLG09_04210 [Negativicutes bacterium]|nr:hypothetical protein [Negativicutes bacterium]